jgi:hypothetical protein
MATTAPAVSARTEETPGPLRSDLDKSLPG